MAANDNQPLGHVPWQLTAAAPGTLNVRIDVEDPVEWEVGPVSSKQGRLTEPLCSPYPVLTTRGRVDTYKGAFTFFIPDTDNRDAAIDAIIKAQGDTTVPYYTWRALDGTRSWLVQFDPQVKINVGYLQGHRVVKLGFIQIGTGQMPTKDVGNLITPSVPLPHVPPLPPPSNSALPSVTCDVLYAYRGENIPVRWSGVDITADGDYIGLFDVSNPDSSVPAAFGSLYLGTVGAGFAFLPSYPTLDTSKTYQLRLITVSKIAITGPQVEMRTAVLSATVSFGVTNDVSYSWSGFDSSDPPIKFTYLVPGLSPVQFEDNISGTSGSGTRLNVGPIEFFGTATGPQPQITLMSGRKILGPLS